MARFTISSRLKASPADWDAGSETSKMYWNFRPSGVVRLYRNSSIADAQTISTKLIRTATTENAYSLLFGPDHTFCSTAGQGRKLHLFRVSCECGDRRQRAHPHPPARYIARPCPCHRMHPTPARQRSVLLQFVSSIALLPPSKRQRTALPAVDQIRRIHRARRSPLATRST